MNLTKKKLDYRCKRIGGGLREGGTERLSDVWTGVRGVSSFLHEGTG